MWHTYTLSSGIEKAIGMINSIAHTEGKKYTLKMTDGQLLFNLNMCNI